MVEQRNWLSNHTPTKKFSSINFLQMPCVTIWAWSFLTFEVLDAVSGQKHHISMQTLALELNIRFIPQRQFCLPKIWEMISVMTFSLHAASISQILEPRPQGLISSTYVTIEWAYLRSFGYLSARERKPCASSDQFCLLLGLLLILSKISLYQHFFVYMFSELFWKNNKSNRWDSLQMQQCVLPRCKKKAFVKTKVP
jgi:hypothetical protein